MDKKVKLLVAPLPEDSWWRIEQVARDPCLRDPKGVRHVFTNETKRRLKAGGGEFLLPKEESKFLKMLQRQGKAFAFSPQEVACVDPTLVEQIVIFTIP